MKKIYDGQEMSRMDQWAIQQAGIPGRTLMERAAQGVVQRILTRGKKRTAVLCGIGNNGGDGFAIARLLHAQHVPTDVYIIGKKEKLNGVTDAAANYQMLAPLGIPVFWRVPEKAEEYGCIVDALFGTGLSREITGEAERAIGWCNEKRQSGAYVIAVDIPSGIDCDAEAGRTNAFKADFTVTFIALKPCFVFPPFNEYSALTKVADIGIKPTDYLYKTTHAVYKKRPKNAHKGTFGTALTFCGSYGMCGASVLSAKSALRSGVGILKAAVCDKNYSAFTSCVPEAVVSLFKTDSDGFADIPEERTVSLLNSADAVLFGCGTGRSDKAVKALKAIIKNSEIPMVLDADGINILSQDINIIRERKAPLIISPHPKEMSRLTGLSVLEIENNRIKAAADFAEKYKVTVILKGANTVVACSDGEIFINTTGNSGMASGGSGDVLSGIIVSLLAQGYSEKDATVTAVYIHGLAGDFAAKRLTKRSMIASDIIEELKFIPY